MATQYSISTGAMTYVATTAKTAIEIPSSATAGITVIGMELCFGMAAASSALVEWGTWATTGTGTTVTPLKYGTGQGVALNAGTVKVNNTVEPASFTVGTLPTWRIPLPGMYSILYPLGREFFQPASVNRALRITMAAVGTAPGNEVRVNLYVEQ
jgi:hypothetical protein